MSLQEKNKILYIFHKNGVSRKHIKKIMIDLQESGIFNDLSEEEITDDWVDLEMEADVLFSNKSKSEKIKYLKEIRDKERQKEQVKKTPYLLEQEKRVEAKRNELIEQGIIDPDKDFSFEESDETITRYGRTPLHEAIAMRDIELVKKYIKSGEYLEATDNNEHTPLEMAFYDGYQEALVLFTSYLKKKKKKKCK